MTQSSGGLWGRRRWKDGEGGERRPGAGRCSRGGAAHGAAAGAFKRRRLRPSRAGLSRAEPSRAPPCACRACRSPSCWRPSPSAPRGRRAARCGWPCWAPAASARAVSAGLLRAGMSPPVPSLSPLVAFCPSVRPNEPLSSSSHRALPDQALHRGLRAQHRQPLLPPGAPGWGARRRADPGHAGMPPGTAPPPPAPKPWEPGGKNLGGSLRSRPKSWRQRAEKREAGFASE